MSVRVTTKTLASEILKEMETYTESVSEAADKAVIKVAKEAQKKLKATRSVQGSNVWHKYPYGWATKSKKKKGRTEAVVHNRDHYRLTHLLENGHVIKNGTGRTYGRTRSFEHIGPVNEEAQKRLEEAIMEAIEKG